MNETPQIKQFHSSGKGTNPESPISPVPSINLVNSITIFSVNSIISNPSSPTYSSSSSSGSVTSFSFLTQLGPSCLILVGFPNPSMENQHAGSLTHYPEFWGKGDANIEQCWFLCEAIRRSRGTLYESKLV